MDNRSRVKESTKALMDLDSQSSTANLAQLRARLSRYTLLGVAASLLIVLAASILIAGGNVALDAIVRAQRSTPLLWLLDLLPLLVAVLLQRLGEQMVIEAGRVIDGQTVAMRTHTAALELQSIHDANHDALTELPNRTLFRKRASRALAHAEERGRRCALLLLDLDRFKEINDTIGHLNGDQVIRQVATRLKAITSEGDILARMGGDEFALLMTHIRSDREVMEAANGIQRSLEAPFSVEGLFLEVQASTGGVLYPEHGFDVDTLLQRADVAMYAAKGKGFDFVTYAPEMDQYTPHRLTLMGELRHAIDSDELVLWYQPQVDAVSRTVAGVEVLVRWMHPVHGLTFPDEFVHLAERSGIINNFTQRVLENALRETAGWRERGLNLNVAVNISARNLLDAKLPQLVAELLERYDYPAAALKLEITETAIMEDPQLALDSVQRIAAMGVDIAIDDFGTGYSSLAYIKRLPVSELKIDKGFVMEMLDDDNDAAIITAIITLAHSLGLEVVAEGVESRTILDALVEEGCDLLQGDHISKPLPGGAFIDWLAVSEWCKEELRPEHLVGAVPAPEPSS